MPSLKLFKDFLTVYYKKAGGLEELSDLLRDQHESVFLKRTLFKSWTVNDVIGHLYMFDLASLKSLQNENEFAKIYSKVLRSNIEIWYSLLLFFETMILTSESKEIKQLTTGQQMAQNQAILTCLPLNILIIKS